MAANSNARFYRLNSLPDFDAYGKHVGLFVYVPEHTLTSDWIQGYVSQSWDGNYPILNQAVTITHGTKVNGGLWFGGRLGWEHLTNVGSGISWQEIFNWFDGNVGGEAEIFNAEPLTNTGETGTEITISDLVLDRTHGLHASTAGSDSHTFTVGDGALKIRGSGATGNIGSTPSIPTATTDDVHSANDVSDSTLILDNSLVWTQSTKTIGVRTKTTVTAENPVVTLQDIVGLNGAMHLIGTLDSLNETSVAAKHLWPDQPNSYWTTGTPTSGKEQIKAGDTFIITTAHTGPDGVHYEIGDIVVYYPDTNGTNGLNYKVVNTNITDGVGDGQHAHNIGELDNGKLVVAVNTGGVGANKGIKTINVDYTNLIVGIDTTQEIANESTTVADEGQIHGATYTVTTTITKPDGLGSDSDSEIETDTHTFTLHSNNNSLTIQEDGGSDGNQQFNFDLVWLTEMV